LELINPVNTPPDDEDKRAEFYGDNLDQEKTDEDTDAED
jgi:hypothetical protein